MTPHRGTSVIAQCDCWAHVELDSPAAVVVEEASSGARLRHAYHIISSELHHTNLAPFAARCWRACSSTARTDIVWSACQSEHEELCLVGMSIKLMRALGGRVRIMMFLQFTGAKET